MANEWKKRFAAIVPVASDPVGLWRGMSLLCDLFQCEPGIGWCVILDDSPHASGLAELSFVPSGCQTVTFTNRNRTDATALKGSLTARLIEGLAWIHSNTDADFVLRIDTDALVIAPFSHLVRSFIAQRSEAGLIGTVGLSCNPQLRSLEDISRESKLVTAHRMLPRPAVVNTDEPISCYSVPTVGTFTARQLCAFDNIRMHIDAAVRNGYTSSEFCQGGAYVITRQMLERMSISGYLRQPEAWIDIPFSEDRVFAMYARAVGLQICDYSRPGEPFGMNFVGLAYPPATLFDLGYRVIHSVKNDSRFSEYEIREFFRGRAHRGPLA